MTPASIALNRFGLGYRRGDALVQDPRGWLERQIDVFDPAPPQLGDRAFDGNALRRVIADTATFQAERRRAQQSGGGDREALEMQQRERTLATRQTFIGDVALRSRLALETDTPFMERLVHFWANHFAVSSDKVRLKLLAGPHEFGAIRPHVDGYFRDLLRSAVLHPAMLAYLDQWLSQGPNSAAEALRTRRGRPSRGLNENLGREILELHTLGVDGGYTQEDVRELARALTGWTLQGLPYTDRATPQPGGAAFFDFTHEPGARTVLGRRYGESGADQALDILDDLARHPATARHIATKLARHFAGDEPPRALVDRLANAFSQSDGHLPTVYRALIAAPEPWGPVPLKFRQPWEWAIAMLRAGGEPRLVDRRFALMLRELGQEVWTPRSPAGWDDREEAWSGANSLLRKVEAAERFATQTRLEDVRELADAMFPASLADATRDILRGAESNEMAFALLMVSPEMMRR